MRGAQPKIRRRARDIARRTFPHTDLIFTLSALSTLSRPATARHRAGQGRAPPRCPPCPSCRHGPTIAPGAPASVAVPAAASGQVTPAVTQEMTTPLPARSHEEVTFTLTARDASGSSTIPAPAKSSKKSPAGYVSAEYVRQHPDEDFYHRGRGHWYRGMPPADFPNYESGTWGPKSADELVTRDGRTWAQV